MHTRIAAAMPAGTHAALELHAVAEVSGNRVHVMQLDVTSAGSRSRFVQEVEQLLRGNEGGSGGGGGDNSGNGLSGGVEILVSSLLRYCRSRQRGVA